MNSEDKYRTELARITPLSQKLSLQGDLPYQIQAFLPLLQSLYEADRKLSDRIHKLETKDERL